MEWEILGDLGLRLHHKEEAKEAYQRCLDANRYSLKPWMKLLDMYTEEGDIQRTLQVAIRVSAYSFGEYAEQSVSCSYQCFLACLLIGIAVSFTNFSMLLQAGSDSWSSEDSIYPTQYGSS